MRIIGIRENTDYLERGIDYFAKNWEIDRNIYSDSISNSLTTDSPLPRWYLMLKDDEIIGSYGLITNDFISRQDLFPWICALFIEEKERGRELGAVLLKHARKEAASLGYRALYLSTDLVGYYEKYSWSYISTGFHPWGKTSRIYQCSTL